MILRGVDLVVNEGEVHALMGPNGAGKSTLASVIMGHPGYTVTAGEILFLGENIVHWTPDARARAGIFLAFQYPEAIGGVSVIQFLRQAIAARKGLDELSVLEVRLDLAEWMDRLGIDAAFAERHLNDGFSGGERKRNEVLQMALLEPGRRAASTRPTRDSTSTRCASSRRACAPCASNTRRMGAVVVTHYVKLLDEIRPDFVHVLVDGRIVHSGDAELAQLDRPRGLRRVATGERVTSFNARRVRADIPQLTARRQRSHRSPTSTRARARSSPTP